MSKRFEYNVEKQNSLPEFISNRSNVWRSLRHALADMKSGEWLKITSPGIQFDNDEERGRFFENARSGGIYCFYVAMGGKDHPYTYPTRLEKDKDGKIVALWVGKEPKDII